MPLGDGSDQHQALERLIEERDASMDPRARKLLEQWPSVRSSYACEELVVKVRGREIRTALTYTTLSGTTLPKVALPRYEDDGPGTNTSQI